jgi:toxin ParE1/3/4
MLSFTGSSGGFRANTQRIADLRSYCGEIAQKPSFDRNCDYLASGLKRSERNRHVIFYRRDASGIHVSRILHQSILPERHILD